MQINKYSKVSMFLVFFLSSIIMFTSCNGKGEISENIDNSATSISATAVGSSAVTVPDQVSTVSQTVISSTSATVNTASGSNIYKKYLGNPVSKVFADFGGNYTVNGYQGSVTVEYRNKNIEFGIDGMPDNINGDRIVKFVLLFEENIISDKLKVNMTASEIKSAVGNKASVKEPYYLMSEELYYTDFVLDGVRYTYEFSSPDGKGKSVFMELENPPKTAPVTTKKQTTKKPTVTTTTRKATIKTTTKSTNKVAESNSSFQGKWQNSYGSTITINNVKSNSFDFSAMLVFGANKPGGPHVGELYDSAVITDKNTAKMYYSDDWSGQTKTATITFKLVGNKLVVSTDIPSGEHEYQLFGWGNYVSISGEYTK